MQAANAAASSLHSYSSPDAAPVNENEALVEFVGFAGFAVIVGVGTVEAPKAANAPTPASARTMSSAASLISLALLVVLLSNRPVIRIAISLRLSCGWSRSY